MVYGEVRLKYHVNQSSCRVSLSVCLRISPLNFRSISYSYFLLQTGHILSVSSQVCHVKLKLHLGLLQWAYLKICISRALLPRKPENNHNQSKMRKNTSILILFQKQSNKRCDW